MFFGPYYVLLLPALLLAIFAQTRVRGTFKKFSQVAARSRITAAQVSRRILDSEGLTDVDIEPVTGNLTDHYDPRQRVLRLSSQVYSSSSLAALGVAAHEAGHAIQHGHNYVPLIARNGIFPVARLGSSLAFPLFFIGLLFNYNKFLMDLGILFFTGAVVFSVITLPVEFNASKRALSYLKRERILTETELPAARSVLQAAALTYVAATAMAVMQLVRMLLLRRSD